MSHQELSTTAALVTRAQVGDEAARNELAEHCGPRLRRMACGRLPRRLQGAISPEDIVQETLMRAFSSIEKFVPRTEGAFFLYLRKILIRVVAESCRKARRAVAAVPLDGEPQGPPCSPVEEAIGRETWQRYQEGLKRLSESQRQAIVLFVECGMKLPEIANALASPSTNAVRMQIARGLGRLAELMDVPGQ